MHSSGSRPSRRKTGGATGPRGTTSRAEDSARLLDANEAVVHGASAGSGVAEGGVEDLVVSVLMDNLPDEYSHNYELYAKTLKIPRKFQYDVKVSAI